jgi:hypothetical protein
MPLPVPATEEDLPGGPLRYYTPEEYAQIQLRRRGVSGNGDHTKETLGPDGSGTPRLYECKWEERYAAALTLVGAVSTYVDGAGKTRISRLLPDTYGVVPDQKWVCTKVVIDPFRYKGTISPILEGIDAPDFDRAHLEATYELYPAALAEDAAIAFDQEHFRYVTMPGFPGADVTNEASYIGLPGGTLIYATADGTTKPAGVPIPYPYGFVESGSRRPFIWRRVPRELWGEGTVLWDRVFGTPTTLPYLGTLNVSNIFGYPAGSLQLREVSERLLPDPLGLTYSWDLTFVFAHTAKKGGHNYFYYHATGAGAGDAGYYMVKRANRAPTETAPNATGDNFSLFPYREMRNLFNPNPV